MPPAVRPLLCKSSTSTAPWPTKRAFEILCRSYASHRPLAVGAFFIPPTPNLPLTEVPVERLLESPTPDKTLQSELNALFTRNPATFYHGTSNFYTLKKNTQVPEICILGRSNVGKSTFVNALANRRGNELAHTSAKAGKTRAMNAYGFGPPPPPIKLLAAEADVKKTEDMPKHSLFIVDMPGYGHKSLKEWGRNITLYLNKRQAIKGAIVLIDGEVGPKEGDLMAIEMLSEAGLKTVIVLTKADKAKNAEVLKNSCKNLWAFLRDTAAKDPFSDWQWDRDFFVTAVGATKKEVGIASVDIARLAVARLAGLVEEKTRPEPEYPKTWSGKVVSFDDLEMRLAPATSSPSPTGIAETALKSPLDDSSTWTDLERAAREKYLSQVAQSAPPKPRDPDPSVDSGWAAMEQAARTQHDARDAVRAPPPSESRPLRRLAPSSLSRPSRRPIRSSNRRQQSRGLHTSTCLNGPSNGGDLVQLAQQYILELRAQSFPGIETPLQSSIPILKKKSTKRPPHKLKRDAKFEPLVQKHTKKHSKMQMGKFREREEKRKARALEIAVERGEKEVMYAELRVEKERLRAEEEAKGLANPSRSKRTPDDTKPAHAEENRMSSDMFAEAFAQVEEVQHKLKGKKLKNEVKKQKRAVEKEKRAERMLKDRPKEEEDPFMAKFANIRKD